MPGEIAGGCKGWDGDGGICVATLTVDLLPEAPRASRGFDAACRRVERMGTDGDGGKEYCICKGTLNADDPGQACGDGKHDEEWKEREGGGRDGGGDGAQADEFISGFFFHRR